MQYFNDELNIIVSYKNEENVYFPNCKFFITPSSYQFNEMLFNLVEYNDILVDESTILNIKNYFGQVLFQLWAYKVLDCQYYGFCPENKYFAFDKTNKLQYDCKNDRAFKNLGINENLLNFVHTFDIILPIANNLNRTVTSFIEENEYYSINDIKILEKIINSVSPEYIPHFKNVLFTSKLYTDNMFIMHKKIFMQYSHWIFPILFTFIKEKNYEKASFKELKIVEFLADILLTTFIQYSLSTDKTTKILELPVATFKDSNNPYLQPRFKEQIAICFAGDDTYAKHIGVALSSLVQNTSVNNHYDIIILDNQISFHHKNLLKLVVKNYKNVHLRFIGVSSYIAGLKLHEREYCNVSTYLRFAILDLLHKYKKVIYLDGDIIVNCDIADMYKIDLEQNLVAACRDFPSFVICNLQNERGEKRRQYFIETLKLNNIDDYFCAGVMIFNIEIMKDVISTQELFDIALSYNYEFQDQDVLNLITQGRVTYLDMRYNHFVLHDLDLEELWIYPASANQIENYLQVKENPYILHYSGQLQPVYQKNGDYSNIYWSVARTTPFYEELLLDMYIKNTPQFVQPIFQKIKFKTKVKNKVAKLFPKETKFGRFLRKIYRKFRKNKEF